MKKYLSDEEFEKISAPFYDNFNEYLINYVLPDVVAFYLANGHYRNFLADFRDDLMDEFIELCCGNDYNKLTLLKIGDVVDKIFEKHIDIANKELGIY